MTSNPEAVSAAATPRTSREPFIDRVLRVLSSVRFGLVMLAMLVVSCFLGMAIMQSNVQGFETYYATLTNSEKLVYTTLGLFGVYSTWWFKALLFLTSLCIILASIDHFPAAWRYVVQPKRIALAPYIRRQMVHEVLTLECETQDEMATRILDVVRQDGLRGQATRKGETVHVFAQRGATNRLGPYFIHVSLLTIFAGGFFTAQWGENGQMPLATNETANSFVDFRQELDGRKTITHQIPFSVTADRIEQSLIDPTGGLEPSNTLDWITRATIRDGGVEKKVVIHLNEPVDYRGYRFFQSGFDGSGDASEVTITVRSADGVERQVVLAKGEPVSAGDGLTLTFTDFVGDFDPASFQARTDGYDNPVAIVNVAGASGEAKAVPAFTRDFMATRQGAPDMGLGVTLLLDAYAKANHVHYLSIQKDPGARLFYLGGGFITLSLLFTFFVPHRRVWAVVEPVTDGHARVTIGGNANRMKQAFQAQFKVWTRRLVDPTAAAKLDEDDDDE